MARRWLWSPTGAAPFCIIQAVEQPGYGAEFPRSSLELFERGKDPADTIERNETVAPPPGATAAVAQEVSGPKQQSDGSRLTVRAFIREQLTPGRTLLQLMVSVPQEYTDQCHPEQIADSFAPTGGEAPSQPPTPAPIAPSTTVGT